MRYDLLARLRLQLVDALPEKEFLIHSSMDLERVFCFRFLADIVSGYALVWLRELGRGLLGRHRFRCRIQGALNLGMQVHN